MSRGLALTKVCIVEDQRLFAEALDVALSVEGFEVCPVDPIELSRRGGHDRLLATLLEMRPQAVLLDLDFSMGGDGVDLIRPLVRARIAVVVVTAHDEAARWGACLDRGARTVLSKSMPLNAILATIRRVVSGQPVLDPGDRRRLVSAYQRQESEVAGIRNRLALLTGREEEVLAHLCKGMPVTEIAKSSYVSEATVRTQVKKILAKLQVTSQLAAVGAAHRAGWVPPRTPGRGRAADVSPATDRTPGRRGTSGAA